MLLEVENQMLRVKFQCLSYLLPGLDPLVLAKRTLNPNLNQILLLPHTQDNSNHPSIGELVSNKRK